MSCIPVPAGRTTSAARSLSLMLIVEYFPR
jgi:hypothetical protein